MILMECTIDERNPMSFTAPELEYLAGQHLGRIATIQPDGTLQVSPVGFRYNPALGSIDVSGYNLTASRKFKNIADNGKVAFVVDDLASVQPWRPRCVEIRETDTPAHSLSVSARNVG
jgi:pyridoxamine 5'-phosphate oxidase family protein